MPRRSSAPPNGDRSLDVLIVSQPADYGVAIYVGQLTGAAVEAGHDVTVFAQEPHPEEYDLDGASVVREGDRAHVDFTGSGRGGTIRRP